MQRLEKRLAMLENKSAPATSGIIVMLKGETKEEAKERCKYVGGPLLLIPAKQSSADSKLSYQTTN